MKINLSQFRMLMRFILLLLVSNGAALSQVRFYSSFESGNMKSVATTDSMHYTVATKEDIGGRWFYFRISGVKDKFISVTVSNSDVKRAVYSYDNKTFQRFTDTESPQTNVFQKTYESDTVFVAYYIPYTLTYLQERIKQWMTSPYVKVDTLGFTLRNLPIEEITITDPATPDSVKYHIWVHARTHPSETPSSWHFDGFIESILAENDLIQFYREHVVFHCIPFTNPDGVYYGRSRTNYDGVDVESNWNKTEASTTQEVKILKKRMAEINNTKVLSVFQNLHSQASPFCTFWIHTASSTSDSYYHSENLFSNLNTSGNSYFTQSDYSYSNLSSTFPEGWLWNNWGNKVVALTYETPYDWYSTGKIVTNENLAFLGEHFMYAIMEYLQISHPKHLILDNKNIVSFWTPKTDGVEFFGNDYLTTTSANQSGPAVFQSQNLPSGKYDVYGWWQADPSNAYDTKFIVDGGGTQTEVVKTQKIDGGQWNYLSTVNLMNSGAISITVNDIANGRVVADAFRILYTGLPSDVQPEDKPTGFVLSQNYPNPFNPTTTIAYSIPEGVAGRVILKIYDVLGKEVATLVNEEKSAGNYQTFWNASGYASGVYYYTLKFGNKAETKGMLLIK